MKNISQSRGDFAILPFKQGKLFGAFQLVRSTMGKYCWCQVPLGHMTHTGKCGIMAQPRMAREGLLPSMQTGCGRQEAEEEEEDPAEKWELWKAFFNVRGWRKWLMISERSTALAKKQPEDYIANM